MARNSRFDVLFEPVRIGPVTAPNRFYQVPHASGMTNALPQVRAAFRGVKAEGGWGVVCTGAVSIHPSSDDSPLPFASLWDDKDVRAHALMADAVHEHGALAGIELWHGGACSLNRTSRLAPLSPSGMPWLSTHLGFMGNLRPRTMDAADIRELRGWQAAGALRAMQAGFDIVYVYAGMGYLPYEFLLPEYNQRTDAYGGSVENRTRLVRELLEVTRDAVGHRCGIALRISLEELRARPGVDAPSEAHEVVRLLGEIPDLWDVKMDSSPTDCAPSRFANEGSHEPIVNFIKPLTTKPVVGVGRFTSPDVMVSQVRRGILDLIGGARPSIADPFLPRKIDTGREHEIRECIGCNICISSWHDGVPVRCTQNPTAGEEWRRGWHPERFAPLRQQASVLIVGGGPAGLECAVTLARRGCEVTVADAAKEFGGRLRFETRLPGLATWGRVVDWRMSQLRERPNVNLYPGGELCADEILALDHSHVVIATGARWTKMLFSPLEFPVGDLDVPGVYTPEDLAAGIVPPGPVVVFDFDNYYLAGAIALQLAERAGEVAYVTTAGNASAWTFMTNELPLVHRALVKAGVQIHTLRRVTAFDGETVTLADVYSGTPVRLACRSLVIVGMRKPRDELYHALVRRGAELKDAGILAVTRIGDALAPGAIVHAVHSGHRHAREFDAELVAAAGMATAADRVAAGGVLNANDVALPYKRDFPL
jgi:dimethylamine/trimethylamine dehydrogenase